MTVVSKIYPALKSFSGKPLGVLSKALGVATCAAVIYDSHVNGKERAYALDQVETGDRFFNQYKQYISCEKESATISKLKKSWYNIQQDFPFYHIGSKTKGYLSGFGRTVVNGLPLIGLSALALKCKNVGKVAGVLLAANAVKTVLYDVVGIGNKKMKTND